MKQAAFTSRLFFCGYAIAASDEEPISKPPPIFHHDNNPAKSVSA
jgi:hypothetical protein